MMRIKNRRVSLKKDKDKNNPNKIRNRVNNRDLIGRLEEVIKEDRDN